MKRLISKPKGVVLKKYYAKGIVHLDNLETNSWNKAPPSTSQNAGFFEWSVLFSLSQFFPFTSYEYLSVSITHRRVYPLYASSMSPMAKRCVSEMAAISMTPKRPLWCFWLVDCWRWVWHLKISAWSPSTRHKSAESIFCCRLLGEWLCLLCYQLLIFPNRAFFMWHHAFLQHGYFYSNGNQYSFMQASFYIIVRNSFSMNFSIRGSSAWWWRMRMVRVTALDIQVTQSAQSD